MSVWTLKHIPAMEPAKIAKGLLLANAPMETLEILSLKEGAKGIPTQVPNHYVRLLLAYS